MLVYSGGLSVCVCCTAAASGSCLYRQRAACVWCRVVTAGRYAAEIKELFVTLNFWTCSLPQPRLPRQTSHLLSRLYVPPAMRQTHAVLKWIMFDITVWCWLSWNKAQEWRETSHTHITQHFKHTQTFSRCWGTEDGGAERHANTMYVLQPILLICAVLSSNWRIPWVL